MADPAYDFTGRDFSAEVERLLTLLGIELPEYTDRNHSDAGIAQVRLTGRETDQLNYYGDFSFQQGFVGYAFFKQYLIDLGRCVDYLPTLASAASTRLNLTRTAESGNDPIAVPKYTAFGRADGLSYLTTEAVAIPSGSQSVAVNAIQGNLVEQGIEPEDWNALLDFSKRPRVALPRGVAAGTVEMWHGDLAVMWTNVASFYRSTATDRHFLLELNGENDSVWLVLGDGVQGQLAPSETVHVRFVQCAEAAGNGGHSTVYLVPDILSTLITCTNIEPATGGAPAESVASLRRMIPAVTATQRRAVIDTDYEALVGHLAGVLHVQCVDRNTSPVWPHRYVGLYVVPDGGGPMSSLLKDQIWAECGAKGHLGAWKERYILMDAVEVPVNFSMRIGLLDGYSAEAVRTAVIAAIQDLMAAQNRTIAGTLTFTELHRAVSAIAGVSWAEFDSPREDQVAGMGEILTAGTIVATVV